MIIRIQFLVSKKKEDEKRKGERRGKVEKQTRKYFNSSLSLSLSPSDYPKPMVITMLNLKSLSCITRVQSFFLLCVHIETKNVYSVCVWIQC